MNICAMLTSWSTRKLESELASLRYCLRIKNGCVTIQKCKFERDYSAEIEETFAKLIDPKAVLEVLTRRIPKISRASTTKRSIAA